MRQRFDLVLVGSRDLGIPLAAKPDAELAPPAAGVLAELIPAAFAVRHTLIPLCLAGEVLSVAMASPCDRETLRRLRLITRCQIQPLSATRAQIRRAIASFYK